MNGNGAKAERSREEINVGRIILLERRPTPQDSGTILLVEDEAFVREVTSQVLESAGFTVLKAANAMEALREFHEHRDQVQLLLTDLIMPGKSGAQLARELKKVCPALRTILMSGYPEVPNQELDEPGFFYLPKPFSMESLLRKVRQVLGEENAARIEAKTSRCAAGSR